MKNNNKLFAFGSDYRERFDIVNNDNTNNSKLLLKGGGIRHIICGQNHTLILKNNGKLF